MWGEAEQCTVGLGYSPKAETAAVVPAAPNNLQPQLKTLSWPGCYVLQGKELLPGHAHLRRRVGRFCFLGLDTDGGGEPDTVHAQYRPMGRRKYFWALVSGRQKGAGSAFVSHCYRAGRIIRSKKDVEEDMASADAGRAEPLVHKLHTRSLWTYMIQALC